jgi:hypothetical protein
MDGLPRKFTVAEDNVQLNGVVFDVVPGKRGCEAFRRVRWEA